jgi:hypothetical protein
MVGASVAQETTPAQWDVAQAVPGFGGYFLDADGAPTVYLLDPARRADAEQALAGFLADRGFTGGDLRIRQGAYAYTELEAWYRAARPHAFGVAGIILGDVDEAANRIRFGVANASAATAVQSAIAQLGIPAAAVIVQQRAPVTTMATLRDDVSPLQGGLQINFLNVGGVVGVSLLCTLGFNAIIDGVSSFITNSHCSQVEGGEETPTDYYQPLQDSDGDRMVNPEKLIATEADDPHWFISLDCPLSPAIQCRWSDAHRRCRSAPRAHCADHSSEHLARRCRADHRWILYHQAGAGTGGSRRGREQGRTDDRVDVRHHDRDLRRRPRSGDDAHASLSGNRPRARGWGRQRLAGLPPHR